MQSFRQRSHLIFFLLGIVPVGLLAMHHIRNGSMQDHMVLWTFVFVLISVLVGYTQMRKSADHIAQLAKISTGTDDDGCIQADADGEIHETLHNYRSLRAENEQLKKEYQDLNVKVMVYSNDMQYYQKKMRKEFETRNALSRYVGKNIVDQLLASETTSLAENQRQEVTILFADIRGFTSIAEQLGPEDVVTNLNRYFNEMVKQVFANNGVLDKFIGDELMAIFGLLESENSSSCDATHAAIAMQQSMQELRDEWHKHQQPEFEIGIGINTGSVIVGNVGAENRMDYTVIGDAVNVASRLERMAKANEIMVSESVVEQLPGYFQWQEQGAVQVKNRTNAVHCYQIIPGDQFQSGNCQRKLA